MRSLPIEVVVEYPRQAQRGVSYILTVDLRFDPKEQVWAFDTEEIPISCLVSSALFTIEFPSDCSLYLHRFGGTYGSLSFFLKAGDQALNGEIYLQFINNGLPIGNLILNSSVVDSPGARTAEIIESKSYNHEEPSIDIPAGKPRADKKSSQSFQPADLLNPSPENFIFASGIEDTFVPQTRPGHRALDEYELMGHYEHWREDLALARELGLHALRWGVPWYKVEPEAGKFDWSWTDRIITDMVDLEINPIINLVSGGTPFWLKREFANKDYPKYVARYAAAFAARYPRVKWYTPLNEPIINALMCGMRGLWAPYLKGERGYIRIMLQLAKGIIQTVNAIKEINPDSVMVHVEATGLTRTVREDLASLANEEMHRGYLCYDLISGRIGHDHLLFPWLVRNGASVVELDELRVNKIPLDVIGMNFNPQWSTRQIYLDKRGRIAFRDVEPEGSGFVDLIRDFYNRYQVPIMITETSAVGSDEARSLWLESSINMIKNLRADGVPVIGYTWFPLFTMIDWRYRFSTEPLENFYLEPGLYKLNRLPEIGNRWLETPLVMQMQSVISKPAQYIDRLNIKSDYIEF